MESKRIIRLSIQTIVLLLLQIFLMNNLRFFSYAVPIIFLYPLLKLPPLTPRIFTTLFAAAVGLFIDVSLNTPGLNMASATLVGYFRSPILLAFFDEEVLIEDGETTLPSFHTMPWMKYLLYLCSMVLLQVASLFLLEAFSVKLFVHTLPYILGSSIGTLLLFLLFESFANRRKNS